MGNVTRALLRNSKKLLLAAGCLLLVLAVSQCRPVSDAALGLKSSFALGARGSCVSSCASAYNDSIRVESDLHTANVKACGDDDVCLALEEARHEAAVDRIQIGRQECFNGCHEQGGGSGGQ